MSFTCWLALASFFNESGKIPFLLNALFDEISCSSILSLTWSLRRYHEAVMHNLQRSFPVPFSVWWMCLSHNANSSSIAYGSRFLHLRDRSQSSCVLSSWLPAPLRFSGPPLCPSHLLFRSTWFPPRTSSSIHSSHVRPIWRWLTAILNAPT